MYDAIFFKGQNLELFWTLTKAHTKWLSVLQPVLAPNYILHKDAREGVAYNVPQGLEIEVYRKVSGLIDCSFDYTSSMLHVNMAEK
jgi:hypothetical protein